MAESEAKPKLLLPFLQPFYDAVIPFSWFVVRAAVGWNLLVHSWGKVLSGPAPRVIKAFADIGFAHPELWYWAAMLTEGLAGIALILGLFTRFFAAAATMRNARIHIRGRMAPSITTASKSFKRILLSRVFNRRRRRFAPLTAKSFRSFGWPLRSTASRDGL